MAHTLEYTVISLTPAQAMEMYSTDWWVGLDKGQAAYKELFTDGVILPFDLYLGGLKDILGRDVHVAEGLADHKPVLRSEYMGLKTKPSGEELEPLIKAYNFTVEVRDERE